MAEIVIAYGHPNVLSLHEKTFEVTKEEHISKRADCIIGVRANRGCADLSKSFKRAIRRENASLRIAIKAGELEEVVYAKGSPDLILTHPTDIVIRKSSYICPRTLAINAEKSAAELDRRIAALLKNPAQKLVLEMSVE